MISFQTFLTEAPAAITGGDAEEIRNQMVSFISSANKPSDPSFNTIRKNAKNIGNDYYTRKNGIGSRGSIELYRASNNIIEFMTYISLRNIKTVGKCMVIESVAKLTQNVYIDNSTYLDKLMYIKASTNSDYIISDKDHTQGATHLWVKIMSIARNNGREVGVFNTTTNIKTPITSQAIALTLRKSGYTNQQNVVLYIK